MSVFGNFASKLTAALFGPPKNSIKKCEKSEESLLEGPASGIHGYVQSWVFVVAKYFTHVEMLFRVPGEEMQVRKIIESENDFSEEEGRKMDPLAVSQAIKNLLKRSGVISKEIMENILEAFRAKKDQSDQLQAMLQYIPPSSEAFVDFYLQKKNLLPSLDQMKLLESVIAMCRRISSCKSSKTNTEALANLLGPSIFPAPLSIVNPVELMEFTKAVNSILRILLDHYSLTTYFNLNEVITADSSNIVGRNSNENNSLLASDEHETKVFASDKMVGSSASIVVNRFSEDLPTEQDFRTVSHVYSKVSPTLPAIKPLVKSCAGLVSDQTTVVDENIEVSAIQRQSLLSQNYDIRNAPLAYVLPKIPPPPPR